MKSSPKSTFPRLYRGKITQLKPNQIFVFGSNTEGIHGAGAALWAKNNAGAIYGWNKGLQGQSYAIITKDLTKRHHPSISRSTIVYQLHDLAELAKVTPHKEYIVAYSGTGYNLNGYTPEEMAEMFAQVKWPENMVWEYNFYKLMLKVKS